VEDALFLTDNILPSSADTPAEDLTTFVKVQGPMNSSFGICIIKLNLLVTVVALVMSYLAIETKPVFLEAAFVHYRMLTCAYE
jgi:hypothetical protein